jgi:membrane protease YdiL (CAAX protease family)
LPFLLSILAILLALPLINWLAEVNSHMHLPSALNGIEEWMKKSETEAAGLTNSFLLSNTWPGFLVNILMMAIIPALGEELLFRGLLIRLFREWTKDVHVAIFISAFIFSAIHMQFYGFFARLMMGVMFGYLLYWTGSIWVPILVHFINNAIIVSFGFAYVRGLTQLNPDSVGSTNNIFVLIGAGILLTIVLLILYRVRHIESPDTSKG